LENLSVGRSRIIRHLLAKQHLYDSFIKTLQL
jgi:hypothetical protein